MNKNIQILLIILSVIVFAQIYGLMLAIALIGMIYFHELGHVMAAKHFGAKRGGIFIIPLVGGIATISGRLSRFGHAVMALWGPLHGLIYTFSAWGLFYLTGNPFFLQVTKFSAYINMFNLLPIGPLDGGQTLKSLAFSANHYVGKFCMWFGVALSVFLAIFFHSPMFIMIAILAYLDYANESNCGYCGYNMTKWQMVGIVALWIGLFLSLGVPLCV